MPSSVRALFSLANVASLRLVVNSGRLRLVSYVSKTWLKVSCLLTFSVCNEGGFTGQVMYVVFLPLLGAPPLEEAIRRGFSADLWLHWKTALSFMSLRTASVY